MIGVRCARKSAMRVLIYGLVLLSLILNFFSWRIVSRHALGMRNIRLEMTAYNVRGFATKPSQQKHDPAELVASSTSTRQTPMNPDSLVSSSVSQPQSPEFRSAQLNQTKTPQHQYLHPKHPFQALNDADAAFPEWMVRYMQWHNEIRQNLNESNWSDYKYLVSRCNHRDEKCGGLADRLRPLPFLVQVAAMSGRLLMFHWERPHDLRHFMDPVMIDWRLPPFVEIPRYVKCIFRATDVSSAKKSTDAVVAIRFQAYKEGQKYFDRWKVKKSDPNFADVVAPLWRAFFRPASAIQEKIDSFYNQHNLARFNYVAIHLRTLYTNDRTTDEEALVEMVRNALACASRLGGSSPSHSIVVVSDSQKPVQIARQLAPRRVIDSSIELSLDNPLHLDRGNHFLENPNSTSQPERFPVEAYYSTFVDFYLLVWAKCLAYDKGGFAALALILSGDSKCFHNHGNRKCY